MQPVSSTYLLKGNLPGFELFPREDELRLFVLKAVKQPLVCGLTVFVRLGCRLKIVLAGLVIRESGEFTFGSLGVAIGVVLSDPLPGKLRQNGLE